MSRIEFAPRCIQRDTKELLRLRLLAALQEQERQVGSQDYRAPVLCLNQTGHVDEDLAMGLHGLSVLALLWEQDRNFSRSGVCLAVVPTEDASLLLERFG